MGVQEGYDIFQSIFTPFDMFTYGSILRQGETGLQEEYCICKPSFTQL